MTCACPGCHNLVAPKDPTVPGPQARYCGRGCQTKVGHQRNVERRREDRLAAARWRRSNDALFTLSDEALARLPHSDLERLGVDVKTGAQQ